MKVGTDAVLLGAWVEAEKPLRILDVGTGCGVIALMLAQRFSKAQIDAIDIDEKSIQEAHENFIASPWGPRMKTHQVALQDWSAEPYDLIVSNPPYFANSFPIPEKRRAEARSQSTLDFESLIQHSKRLLKPEGKLALVLPAQYQNELEKLLSVSKLFTKRLMFVLPTASKSASLLLIESSQQMNIPVQEEIIVRTAGEYHPSYLSLTRDFYLFS